MTSNERKEMMVLASKADALQKIWLREREEQRAMQVTTNAEVRRRWIELDSMQGEAGAAEQIGDGSHHSRPRKQVRT